LDLSPHVILKGQFILLFKFFQLSKPSTVIV